MGFRLVNEISKKQIPSGVKLKSGPLRRDFYNHAFKAMDYRSCDHPLSDYINQFRGNIVDSCCDQCHMHYGTVGIFSYCNQ